MTIPSATFTVAQGSSVRVAGAVMLKENGTRWGLLAAVQVVLLVTSPEWSVPAPVGAGQVLAKGSVGGTVEGGVDELPLQPPATTVRTRRAKRSAVREAGGKRVVIFAS
jgi:hypothetical protein